MESQKKNPWFQSPPTSYILEVLAANRHPTQGMANREGTRGLRALALVGLGFSTWNKDTRPGNLLHSY